MKKNKPLIILMAIIMLAFCTIVPASATDVKAVQENTANDIGITPFGQSCGVCGVYASNYCAGKSYFWQQGTHGLITTCTVNYYRAYSADICHSCYKTLHQYGMHLCWESHTCSRGLYRVCPCDVKSPGFMSIEF